jgi:hypothetical protein
LLHVDANLVHLAERVVAALSTYPFFLRIAGFGDDQKRGKALARLISLSAPLHPRKPLEKLSSARIRIDPEAFAKEGDGTRYSQTAELLAAHTDSSFFPDPHELVAFQMAVPDPSGGESFMIAACDVIAALDVETRDRLREPVFPFAGAPLPILTGSETDPKIRYYRRQIEEEAAATSTPLSPAHTASLDALDAVLERRGLQHRFRLEAGEIVLMNNLRVLHGRTSMDNASRRLMYRVRAWAGCLL